MTLAWLLVVLAALAVGWRGGTGEVQHGTAGEIVSHHSGPTLEQVQALSGLVTTRVQVADVLQTEIAGYTGGVKAALLIRGDFLLGVDLSGAKFQAVDARACSAVLVLPQPRVTSPRLDHEHTKVFAVLESGLWQIVPGGSRTSGAVIDRGYRDAQRFVAAACQDPALIARSRQQAEGVLGAFFHAMGWKVVVRWTE